MTYQRFEDLPVWKDAIALAHGVFDLVEDRAFAGLGDLRAGHARPSHGSRHSGRRGRRGSQVAARASDPTVCCTAHAVTPP